MRCWPSLACAGAADMRRRTAVYVLAAWAAVLAIAVALLTTPAAAAAPLSFEQGTAAFGATHSTPGSIADDWTFSLAGPSIVSASVAPSGSHWLDVTSVGILGDGLALAFESERIPEARRWQAWTLPDAYLPPGDYTLRIDGTVYRGFTHGHYSGAMTVSPIPEPGAWALLLAGLAAVAFVARRRAVT
jgi:hypothetical protein